jgi:hypothetical protein
MMKPMKLLRVSAAAALMLASSACMLKQPSAQGSWSDEDHRKAPTAPGRETPAAGEKVKPEPHGA